LKIEFAASMDFLNPANRTLDRLPAPLRALLDAELAAGNAIADADCGFPAPPAGLCVKLTQHVTTRPRESTADVAFYDRNGSTYSGEFHDAKRFFFIIEPPHPQPPEPEYPAPQIPAVSTKPKSKAKTSRTPDPADRKRVANEPTIARAASPQSPTVSPAKTPAPMPAVSETPLARFERSLALDYEKWHDGIGYDLAALRAAGSDERLAIERLLLGLGLRGWREVEAFAVLDTRPARDALQEALESGNAEVRAAVMDHAPDLVSGAQRRNSLVAALESGVFYAGLRETLEQVETYHPPEIVDALLRGALTRDGDAAGHFAAMLFFIHGQSDEVFDMNQRPFFLRFDTADRAERATVFAELCTRIGVNAERYLTAPAR